MILYRKPRGIAMSHRPVAIGLLLCEQVIVEEGTKNVTPVNCFIMRTAETFPWKSPPFLVLAWLTNGDGEVRLDVIVEEANSLEELYRSATRLHFSSPLQQGRLSIRLHEVTFPRPGKYRVVLLADGEMLAQRKLTVSLRESCHE
jgi:hypothetical protein